MRFHVALAVPLLLLATIQEEAEAPPKGAHLLIRAENLVEHVEYLASDELQGRYARSPEAKIAAEYLVRHLEEFGVEPFGEDGTWFHDIGGGYVPNVMGVLRGEGEGYVFLTAHFDHLRPARKGEDKIFNGADDNASGTSAVLENARAFAAIERPGASIVFLFFTAEEMGLLGSREWVKEPTVPLEEILGVINMDMISRGKENLLYCEGGPKAPALFASLMKANETIELDLHCDEHPEWIPASDHYPFIQKGVPAIYLGVEDHEDYHKVTDHADKVIPELIEKTARLAFLAARDLAETAGEAKAEPAEAGAADADGEEDEG